MPSVSCSFCQTPNLSGAAYCRRCQRPLPVRAATVPPPTPDEARQHASRAGRPTEPINMDTPVPLARRPPAPFPVMSNATPRATAPLPTSPPRDIEARPSFKTMQSAPTQMLDLAALEPLVRGEDTVVGPLPAKPRPSPKLAIQERAANSGPARASERDLSDVRALFTKVAPTSGDAQIEHAAWPRKLVALAIDALLPLVVLIFWTGAEAMLFAADWPEGHGDFLWSMAQWLHLHYSIGLRGVLLASIVGIGHVLVGAHSGRTLGQGLLGLRLVREKARGFSWSWSLGYGLLSFGATLCCGANIYFMIVEGRQRTLAQSLFRADLVCENSEANPSFSLGTP